MKRMIEDPNLLAHTRRVAEQRRAAAIARIKQAEADKQRANVAAMHLVAKAGA